MPANQNYPQPIEVNLKDLFFHLLYRWRSILLVALACAMALVIWQNYNVDSTHSRGELTEEEESWEISVRKYQNSIENARNTISTRTQQIADEQEYLRNSIYLNLNSENEWIGSRVWYLSVTPETLAALPEGGQADPVDYAINAYSTAITSNLDPVDAEGVFGTSQLEYIWEICSVIPDMDANTISVQVCADSAEKVETVLNFFTERMDTTGEEKAQAVSRHTRMLMSESVQQSKARETRKYEDKELDRTSEIKARQENIEKWQQDVSDAQSSLNKLIRQKEPAAPGKHILRFAVIGFVIGTLIMALIYVMTYIFGGRVHTSGEFSRAFRYSVYGSLAHSRARRPGKGIDGLIEKWEFRHAERDDRKIYECVSVLMREKTSESTLLLTGTLPTERLEQVKRQLESYLSGWSIDTAPDFLRNADAVAQAGAAGLVLLVEEKYVTRLADVRREREILDIGGITVKGTILL